MSAKNEDFRRLTREELDRLAGEQLPERAAMSLIDANIAIPINTAIAAKVLSDSAVAYADAAQDAAIDQGKLSDPTTPPEEVRDG